MNKNLQERMAIAGHRQAMDNVKTLCPKAVIYDWETESEQGKENWLKIAEAMHNAEWIAPFILKEKHE